MGLKVNIKIVPTKFADTIHVQKSLLHFAVVVCGDDFFFFSRLYCGFLFFRCFKLLLFFFFFHLCDALGILYEDGAGGALGCADTTVDAFGVVDLCQIVFDVDGVFRAILFTKTAGNASDRAVGAYNLARIVGGTFDFRLLFVGHETDDVFRANVDTFLTSNAFFLVDGSDAVVDVDGVKFADAHAGAAAQAAGSTALGSARIVADQTAVDQTAVFVYVLGLFTVPLAAYDSNFFFNIAGRLPHDFSYFFSNFLSANGASVNRRITGDDGIGQPGTTGEPTGPTVCARQCIDDIHDTRIHVYSKYLIGKC